MSLPVLSSCPGQWDRPNRRLRPYRSVSPKPSREKQMLVVSKRLGDLSSCPPFFKINLAPKGLQTNQAAVPVASALKRGGMHSSSRDVRRYNKSVRLCFHWGRSYCTSRGSSAVLESG